MNKIGRIVIRPAFDNEGRGDLIIGGLMKNQAASPLKAGHVYEISTFDGAIILTDKGPSAISRNAKDQILPHGHWLTEIGQLLAILGKRILQTKDEALAELHARPLDLSSAEASEPEAGDSKRPGLQ